MTQVLVIVISDPLIYSPTTRSPIPFFGHVLATCSVIELYGLTVVVFLDG